jgi:hypothetical protein
MFYSYLTKFPLGNKTPSSFSIAISPRILGKEISIAEYVDRSS